MRTNSPAKRCREETRSTRVHPTRFWAMSSSTCAHYALHQSAKANGHNFETFSNLSSKIFTRIASFSQSETQNNLLKSIKRFKKSSANLNSN